MLPLRRIVLVAAAILCAKFTISEAALHEDESSQHFDLSSSESENNLLDPDRVLRVTPPDSPSSNPWFTSVPVRALHESLFEKVFNLLLRKGVFFNSVKARNESAYNFKTPLALCEHMDFELGDTRENETTLLTYLEQVIDYSPHPSHPFYLTRGAAGLDPYALAGEWLSATINNLPLVYYLSPVSTMMELVMTQKLRELIGYPNGEGDGIPAAGASVSNFMAVNMALQNKFPNFKQKGFVGAAVPKFAIFLSQLAARCFVKAQLLIGFPADSLVWIPTETNGRMNVSALEIEMKKAQTNGVIPVMVVGTAGTPMLGAIDPLNEIAAVSEKLDVWFHVDASWGGAALFSSKQRSRLKGIEKSDSVTWDWSKSLGSMYSSTFLLTKRSGALYDVFGHAATYVFFTESGLYNISYDRGDSTIQTSRRAEIMKSWFLWKGKGQKGLAAAVDLQYENLDFFVRELNTIKRNGRFRTSLPEYDTPTVSFFYVPLDIEAIEKNSTFFNEELNEFTIDLKEKLAKYGLMYVSLNKCPRTSLISFTVSLANTALTKADISYIVQRIAFEGESLELNITPNLTSAVPPPPDTYPSFVSAPIASLHRNFFVSLFQMFLKKGLFFQNKRKDPPSRFRLPAALYKLMDLTLGEEPLSEEDLLKEFEGAILYTPHYAHPYFILQLMGGLDAYTIVADYVLAAVNSPMVAYEGSPVMTLMEKEAVEAMCKVTGYSTCDGTINDGGSFSNMMGIALARYKKYPEVRKKGNGGTKEFVLFVSEDAHYSFSKGAFTQGHGVQGVILVPTDARGRMDVTELRKLIKQAQGQGKVPFMVGATAGTTIFGAIDPLDEIADICAEFKIWFHVDGIYGGPLLFSKKYKDRLKGVERSDSFGLNWHKIFSGAHTMSLFVTRHPGILQKAFKVPGNLNGFFPSDTLYDRKQFDDSIDKQIQGSRRGNVLKIWFLWKAKGITGLGMHVDYAFDRFNFLVEEIKRMDGFDLLIPEFDVLNVCFYYVPKRLRGIPKDETYWKELEPIAPRLYADLGREGILNIIAQNRGKNDTTFLKIPYFSSGVTDDDSKYILQVIDTYGKDL